MASAPTTSSNALPDPTMSVSAPAVAPPSTPGSTVVTPSLWDQAVQMAQDSLNAQEQPLQGEIAANNAQSAADQQAANADAAAVSELLKQIAPAISNVYGNATQDVGTLAKGFSTDFQNNVDQAGGNVNDLLAKIGAPAGQMVDPSKAADAANVLYGLGGFIPGQSFAEQGAAAAGAAAQLPGIALLTGLANAKNIYNTNAAANAKIQQSIATLAGKLPGDAQTNFDKLSTLALNDQKFQEQLRHNKVTEAQAAARISTSEFTAKTNAYYKGVSATQAATRLALDSAKFAQTQLQQNRMYKLDLAKFGLDQYKAQTTALKNAYALAHGGFSQTEISRFQTKMDALLSSGPPTHAKNGVMPTPTPVDKNGNPLKINPRTGQPVGKAANWVNANTYDNFVSGALKKGVPIQLVLQKADSIWPATERGNLGSLTQIPQIAAEAAAQKAGYAQATGQTLGVSPTGTPIHFSMPKALPANLSTNGRRQIEGILSTAREYLGTPYAWGGESPTGFDCSGLAQYAYAKEGVNIPRTTYAQWQSGINVPPDQLQYGDLVFFKGSDSKVVNGQTLPGHVGIYVGDGLMIDAPNSGSVVRVESVSGFGGYMGARRYVH